MEKLLEVRNLEVSFSTYAGEVQAVRNVSFDVRRNETVAIVGESGCGKSVTSKAIMGLLPPHGCQIKSGEIIFNGKDVLNLSDTEHQNFCGKECAMIFQDALSSLNPTLTVGTQVMENLVNHTDLNIAQRKERAIELLQKVGISDSEKCMQKYPMELSGGMRQRVMIASAIICHPNLLIADEPTTALDVTIQAQVLELLRNIQEMEKMSIILITHDLGVVAQMAERIIVMYAGKIVEQGTSHDIFYHPQHPYTWALLHSVPRLMNENGHQRLQTIEGNLPSSINPHEGCAFANRCPYCMNICQNEEPKQYSLEGEHRVSCWLQESMADKSEIPFLKGAIK